MKRIFQISLGIMLSVFCLMLVSCKGNEQPADHQVTEIVPAATGTAETEPEQTTVSVPVDDTSNIQCVDSSQSLRCLHVGGRWACR